MSKGSWRRPQKVGEEELARNWSLVFRSRITLDDFLNLWYDEIQCYAAETGADREMAWDPEAFEERLYEEYLKGTWPPKGEGK